ncbi:efflux RND transporter periplasmic adaptor subunit [Rheinheimera sp. UJ63]|uniref:efflux RND transporter periplasmic adaptor subunit n=1 Tax=Rheinheimera sp. UJ63 TaxID=2910157 RepID=UPI001F43D9A1|nr:efflux RND transporter periplasmic adaptor subunit [Rheinheimera sp. UJ63]MCF4009839.1 efflux RND transporter periplasmic adaptor subunit [Rheinheimera sp. UJ63]
MLLSRVKSPLFLAILLTLLLALWLIFADHRQASQQAPEAAAPTPSAAFTVQTQLSNASAYPATQQLQGQIMAWHSIDIKAQVAGQLLQLNVEQGDKVKQGTKLLQLSDEGRTARLQQAKALYHLRQSELQSAQQLTRQQFVSKTELARLQSDLASAEANLAEAELNLAHTQPTAPFDGVLARRYSDPGSRVQVGDTLFQLVDISQLRVTAQVPQQRVAELSLGQTVAVNLMNGQQLNGSLSFISPVADAQSRSYYIEATVANPQLQPLAGASATLVIALSAVEAHQISPALLRLDPQGRLGLYTVENGVVQFYPISLLSTDNNSAWITGLPAQAELIIQGAGFVAVGQAVTVQRGVSE